MPSLGSASTTIQDAGIEPKMNVCLVATCCIRSTLVRLVLSIFFCLVINWLLTVTEVDVRNESVTYELHYSSLDCSAKHYIGKLVLNECILIS